MAAAFLSRARKLDLENLAGDLGLIVPENTNKLGLIKLIMSHNDYEEELTRNLLKSITDERETAEKAENLAKERELVLDKERSDKERLSQEIELKKLEIQAKQINSENQSVFPQTNKNKDILNAMTRYETSIDISIYLDLFEKQAKRLGIGENELMVYLPALLPIDINAIISRETDEVANDYKQVKKILLSRFKMSPENFKIKFSSHRKQPNCTYKDFSYELKTYFEEYIEGLGVTNFEQLKELMVVDQIKRKLPTDIKNHFIDELPTIIKISDLTEKLDSYEIARYYVKRETKTDEKPMENKNKKPFYRDRILPPTQACSSRNFNSYTNNTGNKTCYICKGRHLSYSCPRRNSENYKTNSHDNTNSSRINSQYKSVQKINKGENKILKEIKICDTIIESTVDKGPEVSIIDAQIYNSLNAPALSTNNVSLTMAGDYSVPPTGYFQTEIELDENNKIVTDIYVLANLGCPFVLGRDVLSKIDYMIKDNYFQMFPKRVNFIRVKARDKEVITASSRSNVATNSPPPSVSKCRGNDTSNKQFKKCGLLMNGFGTVPREMKLFSVNICSDLKEKYLSQNGQINELCRSDLELEKKRISYCRIKVIETNFCNQNENSCVINKFSSKFEGDMEKNHKSFYLGSINLSNDDFELDISHIVNCDLKKELYELIKNYTPNQTKSADVELKLTLEDNTPVVQKVKRFPFPEQKIISDQIQEWLKDGIITESVSNYSSNVVLCKKKDGRARVCINYRPLNKKIVRDQFPSHNLEEVIDRVAQAKFYSTLDLKNGFFHIPVAKESRKYTAFSTPEGIFEYKKMPFGLSNSPPTFQRYINRAFKELLKEGVVIIYMDDIIVPAETEKEALDRLKIVFQVASEYGLDINFKKCQFLKTRIEFLGYQIEDGRIEPSVAKIAAVKSFPEPKTIKDLQSFLGLSGYFRKFIPGYAKIARPLSDMLRNDSKFIFGSEQQQAFNHLKTVLSEKPVLHLFRQGAPLELHTDASSKGFGAILLQEALDGKSYHPIYYWSRKTNAQQEKYNSYELEVLAIVEAVKKFRNYLLGSKFKIITDCDAFQKTLYKKDLTPKVARWCLILEEFDYEVVHRTADRMKHVDALSRHSVLFVNISPDELTLKIRNAQRKDEHLNAIKTLIEKGETEDFLIKNEVLYKTDHGKELLVIPLSLQGEIIREIHNKGHFGKAKTEAEIKQSYYIPKLSAQVEEVINNCVKCILCNRKRGKGEGMLHPIPKDNSPLDTYHIDFLGPLASSNKNYNHLFAIIDSFTKFTWLYPVKTTSSKEVIQKLKLQQATFGNPRRIICDRGTAFTSKEFTAYCEEENVQLIHITTGIPRGNGQIERTFETIIPVLTKMSIKEPEKWFKHVSTLQRVINSSSSRSTHFTPFQMLTGVKLKQNNDLEVKEMLEQEHLNTWMKEREDMRDIAKANILKLQAENCKQYNKKRKKAHQYHPGDLVAIQRTQFGSGLKLRPRFHGPYQVIRAKPHDRYDVEKVGEHEGPIHTSTAADHMKPWN